VVNTPDNCPLCGGILPSVKCAVCREELPARGNRRIPIPHLGGRKRLVHATCAEEVERQQTLYLTKPRTMTSV
jgi:hypothetical protein